MIRNLLQREIRQMPALMIAERARWTLNAFAGGYRHMVTKQGVLAEVAEEGRYRLIMEGLEAFVGLTEVRSTEREDEGNFATTPQGQRYLTALPGRN